MSGRRKRPPLVNRALFEQVGADSGALTALAAVAHRLGEPGEYRGVAERGEETLTFHLRADPSSPKMQLNVDLVGLGPAPRRPYTGCDCAPEAADEDPDFVVNPSGFVLFHVSHGQGGYRVRVGRDQGGDRAVFDSARLQGDDLFMLTLVRPGVYVMRNTLTKARGQIVVPYPKVGKKPLRPGGPVNVKCTEKAVRPARVKAQPGQGIVWHVGGPARVKVSLTKPDDGPKRPPR